MRPFASFAVWFACGMLATCLAWSAVAVFALGGFEIAWGKGPTFQVLVWISIGVSLIALFSSGFGAKIAGMLMRPPRLLSASLGLAFVFLSALIGWGMEAAGWQPNRPFAVGWLVATPMAIAYLVASASIRGRPVTSNKSLERTREG
jgi:hypothetical protein